MHALVLDVEHAASLTLMMIWQMFWGLALGFLLSAVIEVLVDKSDMRRLLPDSSPRSIAIASGMGAASSSCSYAAVAIARSMFRKGADFIAVIAFQFASTNLVIELGILLAVLLAWQFTLAEFVGGALMIVILTSILKVVLRRSEIDAARVVADRGAAGKMEGHAQMATMRRHGSWRRRLFSSAGWIDISHAFVMNWTMLWKEIAVGLVIAGALGAWVLPEVWKGLFLVNHPVGSRILGAFIGPLVAVASFSCSIGNIPLAAILWNGGISFGGVVAFMFGDLIILPILNIYRKYYGARMSLVLVFAFYAAMVLAALIVEFGFGAAGLIPTGRPAPSAMQAIHWNYASVLDLIMLCLAGLMVIVFVRSGGPKMMKSMHGAACEAHTQH